FLSVFPVYTHVGVLNLIFWTDFDRIHKQPNCFISIFETEGFLLTHVIINLKLSQCEDIIRSNPKGYRKSFLQ
ncbi:MAG: hypothetical protein AAF696_26170, partial [Bacteroidota bacterium]